MLIMHWERRFMNSMALVEQFRAAPPGKLYCLHGSPGVFRLSLMAAGHALLNDVPVTVVDGSNRFDLYGLAEFARRSAGSSKSPEQILHNIFISRAFTCYQMEALLTERLPAFVAARRSPVVLIFGLLDTFYDEQAPLFEVRNALERILGSLQALRDDGVALLLASMDVRPASPARASLFPRVAKAMDLVYRLSEEADGRWLLERFNGERRTGRRKNVNSTLLREGSITVIPSEVPTFSVVTKRGI
jgi:hypothetical protein